MNRTLGDDCTTVNMAPGGRAGASGADFVVVFPGRGMNSISNREGARGEQTIEP